MKEITVLNELKSLSRSKYKNEWTTIDNIKFQSRKEANRYLELKMLETAGAIKNLELQPKFLICPQVKWNTKTLRARYYIADFKYEDKEFGITIEDVKGKIIDIYSLKRSLFLSQYPQYHFIET